MGKGEIARYEQFSFTHSIFKRLVSQGRQKVSLCGNGLTWTTLKFGCLQRDKHCGNQLSLLTHSHTTPPFDAPGKQAFRKHWEKEKLLVTTEDRLFYFLFNSMPLCLKPHPTRTNSSCSQLMYIYSCKESQTWRAVILSHLHTSQRTQV